MTLSIRVPLMGTPEVTGAESLNVAAINASVIAILIAALSLYVANVLGALAELRRQILETVDGVNSFPRVDLIGSPEVGNGPDSMRANLNRFVDVAMGIPVDGIANSPQARGDELLRLMGTLGSHYPFPCRVKVLASGGVELGAYEPVQIRNLADVQSWLRDAEKLAGQIHWVAEGQRDRLHEALQASASSVRTGSEDLMTRLSEQLSPADLTEIQKRWPDRSGQHLYDAFLANVGALAKLSKEVRVLLNKRSAYMARTPKWLITIFALTSIGALACGVIIPILFPDIPKAVYAWVPAAFYLLASVMGLAFTCRVLFRGE